MRSIDVLPGIIPTMPAYEDHDFPELFTFKAPVDHYSVTKGSNDRKSPNYTTGCHQKKPAINIPAVGSLYKKETSPGINYNGIELTTTIQDGIIAEITPDLHVTLNGVTIAYSPKFTLSKTGKDKARTQAARLKFCKAVIWALINDETSLKDKLSEIGYIPPTVKDFMVEEITLSPYPGIGATKLPYHDRDQDDIEDTLVENGMFRNRDYHGLPISGSNMDTEISGESEFWDRALAETFNACRDLLPSCQVI